MLKFIQIILQNYQSKEVRRDLKLNTQRNPQGYETRPKPRKLHRGGLSSEEVVLIYSKDGNKKFLQPEPIKENDFLYPSKKKVKPKIDEFLHVRDNFSRFHS